MKMDELGVEVKRLTIISIRKGYKLVCDHPVLVGMFLFMFFMYRSFPFLFSLLVYNSPVLVSTAFLLGFLLSLGDPNIPEIDENEESVVSHEIDSLRAEALRHTTVVERDGSFIVKRSGEVVNFSQDRAGGGLGSTGPLIEDYFTETRPGSRDIEGVESVNKRKHDETVFLENQYSRIVEMDDENVGLLGTKSPVGSIGSVMAEQGDSPPSSPWKQFGERDDDVGDEDSDSGSDLAESSSPDASMADILPMLDELHPLLNEGTPLVTRGSDHGSNQGSDHSSHISRGYMEVPDDSSDEESENHDDEGDETGEAKDDESKPEITTWTEDDQKNLMDLGSLELERNQRLENLIARRKARKLMVEKNLIDLNVDLPFTVTPILTARMNPFDLPHDSNANMGLPPIPGSAPSIMSLRRNPFDLPYDSSEEKPDLTEDSFQEEFSPRPFREKMFRRHESFNVGPSIFGPPKNDRDDFKFRPFFVPEGSSHSSFQRQTSELSDISKVSSVPETESICSHEDQDDKKIIEDDILGEAEIGSDVEDHTELVGHESESSEDEDFVELGGPTERDMEHDEVERPSVSLGRSLSTIEEVHYSSGSSSSSSSEEHERVSDAKKHEGSSRLELEMDKIIDHGHENKEPVYDLSPSSIRKNLSYSSISSDLLIDQPSEMDNTVVSLSDRQIDFCTQNTEMDAHGELNSMGTNESHTSEVTLKGEQNLDQGLSEYDEKLDHLEEHDQSKTSEEDQASSFTLSLDDHHVKTMVQSDLVEEHSIGGDEEILQSNEDQIQSSGSTGYSKSLSVEKPMDELHFLEKPVVGLSSDNHEEILEQPTVQLESIVEVHNEENAFREDHILDPVAVQNFDFQSEKTSFEIHEPDAVEEGDEIQEMDEGLLMELDNVGDFSIGELGSSSNEMPLVEARSIGDIDILLRCEPIPMKNEAEINSGMLVFEAEEVAADAPSIEKTEEDCSPTGEEIENETVFEPIRYDEIDSAMHELEATSIEDINTAFRKINDGEGENSAIVDSLDARSVSEQIEAEVAEISKETDDITLSEQSPYGEIDSAVRELQTTSVEDTNKAFRQINEGNFEQPVVVESLDAESFPEKLEAEMLQIETPVLKIVEARSIEDIDLAFKRHNDTERYSNAVSDNLMPNTVEVVDNAEEIISGMIGLDSTSAKNSDEAFNQIDELENSAVLEPTQAEDIDSGMNQLEAQSLVDLNSDFRQIKEELENPVPIETLEADAISKNSEVVVSEIEKPELPVVESRSAGDIGSSSVEVYDIEKNSSSIPEGDKPGIILADDQAEETSSNLLEFDAKSVEDIFTAVFEPLHPEEMDWGMKEFEARSPEDLKSMQIEDEAIESYVIVASPETDLVPEIHETGISELERLELSVVEARSIEYIGLSSQQVHDIEKYDSSLPESDLPNTVKAEEIRSELLELDDTQFIKHRDAASSSIEKVENPTLLKPIPAGSIYLETKDLEARSLQDIDLTFRPIKGQVEEPVVVASLMADLALEQSETGVSETETLEMPVVEASSIDDIGLALKHVHGSEEKSSPISEYKPIIVDVEDHDEEISSKMLELDAQSIEDIDAAFGLIKDVEQPAVVEPNPAETTDLEMKDFDARPLDYVDRTFRNINEEVGMPVSAVPPTTDFAPDKSEAGVSEIETPELPVVEVRPSEVIGLQQIRKSGESSNSISVNDGPVIEEAEDEAQQTSRSIEDIDSLFNQIKNTAAFEPDHAEEITSGMKELEEQSFEDIESALGHFKEEESEKPLVLESLNSELVSEEVEAEISESGSTQNKPSLEETPKMELPVPKEGSTEYVCNDKPSTATEASSLHVESENKPNSIDDTLDIELRSQGDSHPARSVKETENLEKQLKSEIEDVSVLTKSNDILLSEKGVTSINDPDKFQTSGDFLKDVESSVENSSLLETSTGAKESELNINMPSAPLKFDDLSSSLSNRKDKKGKSRKSKSGSSSSSSSSSNSSDSD